MKAHYRTPDTRLTIEIEGANIKELVKSLSSVQDVFEAEKECGLCHKESLRYQHRIVEDNDFYELICNDCGAQFSFGQHKKSPTLFPKRKNGVHGWSKYQPNMADEAA